MKSHAIGYDSDGHIIALCQPNVKCFRVTASGKRHRRIAGLGEKVTCKRCEYLRLHCRECGLPKKSHILGLCLPGARRGTFRVR